MPTTPSTWRLDAPTTTLIFDLGRGIAELAYLGPRLPIEQDDGVLCGALQRGAHESEPDERIPPSVLPCSETGYPGAPLVEMARSGHRVALRTDPLQVEGDDAEVRFRLDDTRLGLSIRSRWCARSSGVIEVDTRVIHEGDHPLQLSSCASLVLPLPTWATHVIQYTGRWAAEMQATRTAISRSSRLHGETRGGRSGFSGGQWLIFESSETTEHHGLALAVHLAWSGDHIWALDVDCDGVAVLSIGGRVRPGEITVSRDHPFVSPSAVLAVSAAGRAALRQMLHRHVIDERLPKMFSRASRKVHLNTWEACGFDLSLPKLKTLAEQAAALGVERFILDDGWFAGRRNDRTSLGDWTVSTEIFPDGLNPLIRHVEALGMDFGLWVEPEMVSPESELHRLHPEWCLAIEGIPRATQRHQLVLDLTQPAVVDHVYSMIDTLLRRYPIAALKWDHNRELFPMPSGSVRQTQALYRLLDRLRQAHPAVEIETCASGGGRVDYAVLSRCTRFWASDNNDPIERLRINRSWLQFLPLRTLGHHVGPSPNPITGRILPMDFRAKVAMFGHMGVEADPSTMSEADRSTLKAHIAHYKAWREVIHDGALYELNSFEDGIGGWFVVEGDRGLALVTQTLFARHFETASIRLHGLQAQRRYRVRLLEPWPELPARYLADPHLWREGQSITGAALAFSGISLPLRHPETAWLVAVEAE